MDLSTFKFPEISQIDMAFSTLDADKDLLEEANSRNLEKGREKFSELFYNGGKIELQKDVKGTWKEKAFLYARALMGSWEPKHEHKEAICAMIFEETLILDKSFLKKLFNK
jgi:hypothetical protein